MTKRENTFLGVFDTQAEVLSKVQELKAQGYREEDMYVVGQTDDHFSMVENQTGVHTDATGTKEDEGFMGKFMSALAGESSSMEAFNGMGLDRDESDEYYRQVQNGKLVLYVDSEYGESYQRYSDSYSGSSAYARDTDTDTGSTFGSTSGASDSTFGTASGTSNDGTFGSTSGTTDSTGSFGTTSGSTTDEETIRLHEERLNVDKERVQTGEVNVGKHVVEDQQTIEVPVEREEVYIERRPVNEEAATSGLTGSDTFNENETINVPVTEERVNVSKSDVVSEEITVGKRKVQDTETVSETVRREEADIDEDTDTNLNKRNDKF
ncbi:YsnF/AvaK domain-containing protein [Planococcus sp. YIM B11945]|uniref:YsnF/AvaK domain-containing protein n=1 Tax=Planococcus sp. YIM B11945 TaxID=3435410 RepID=UPI003D7E01C6